MTSRTLDHSEILNLIETARPLTDVRDLLLTWIEAGASRDAIRSVLNQVTSDLQAAGREADRDRALEALDLVEGWVSPHLKLPIRLIDDSANGAESASTTNVVTVLMPTTGEFAQIETELVIPALTEAGFQPQTPSQETDAATTVFALIEGISRSTFVVIDATGLEPFLLYALGVAHAVGRPTLVLTQDLSELPFDLRSYNVVPYSTRLDEIGQLKAELRRVVRELGEVGYASATPVTDLSGRRRKAASDEATSEDEELPGLFDLLPSSIAAMNELGAATTEFGALTEQLATATQDQATEIEVAKARGGSGAFARTHQSVKAVAAHVDEYADRVADLLPRYREQWQAFINDMLGWLELVDIQSDDDRYAARTFSSTLGDLQQVIGRAAQDVEGFRQAVVDLRARRLSKELGRSLGRVDKQLKEWTEQVLKGASHLERMRALLGERLSEDDN